ncbi:alpha/beta fold hydrolase [Sinorhizobium americanum]|uniref:alpha/beta fold hydrolase n=1 Tax=Sinorhizobium americanum TaxID=194963 RepID=UPI001FDA560C|nr:alpha/beta fold hydrolase [Sinorhizobium americanum]
MHGFPDHPPTARPFLAELGRRGRHVVAPWFRGYAPSPTAGPFDMAALTSDVLALIDRWSPGRAVELVGHDWGGAITYDACVTAPGTREATKARLSSRTCWIAFELLEYALIELLEQRREKMAAKRSALFKPRESPCLDLKSRNWAPICNSAPYRRRDARRSSRSAARSSNRVSRRSCTSCSPAHAVHPSPGPPVTIVARSVGVRRAL